MLVTIPIQIDKRGKWIPRYYYPEAGGGGNSRIQGRYKTYHGILLLYQLCQARKRYQEGY